MVLIISEEIVVTNIPLVEINKGVSEHIAVIEAFIPVGGQFLVDVGCGDGSLCRELASRGASVLGIEPDPIQAEKNNQADIVANVSLMEGEAQNLPLEDSHVDGLIFQYSFHHIPQTHMKTAIDEAVRVSRSNGFLYVAEPLPEGSFHETIRYFHDETLVRGAALNVLRIYASKKYLEEKIIHYVDRRQYGSFDEFAEYFCALSFNSDYTESDVTSNEVQQAFEQAKQGDSYVLDTPVRVNFYQNLKD